MKHLTYVWLRKYANMIKLASYHDKLATIYEEKNPYYLLEWLLFPPSADQLVSLDFERTPSMIKNQYIAFPHVFFQQIVYQIAFKASTSPQQPILHTAIADLRAFYGDDVWEAAVRQWEEQLQLIWPQLAHFQQELEEQYERLMEKYNAEIAQIKQSGAHAREQMPFELQSIRLAYERQKNEVRQKLLKNEYGAWPLIAYLDHHRIDMIQAQQQLNELKNQFLNRQPHRFQSFIVHNDYAGLLTFIQRDRQIKQQFLIWYPAYASQSLLNVEFVDTEKRQQWWLDFLTYLHDEQHFADPSLWDLLYDISGISHLIVKEGKVPNYFHHLVSLALQRNKRISWLKEAVILRHIDVFTNMLMQKEYDYRKLSWVLCLDPDTLEERLMRVLRRREQHNLSDSSFIIERLSDIFIDAIRQGLQMERMTPLFRHLTVHHIDFIYSYIHNIKEAEEFFPLLSIEPLLIQRIFGGKGIRATEARRALRPLYIKWMGRMDHSEENMLRLRRWSVIYYADKNELVQMWLEQLEDKPWPDDEATLLADMMQIEWIGQRGDRQSEHEQVSRLLKEQSDFVKFETDVRLAEQEGLTYEIVRPGYRDNLTFQLLARLIARAKVTDAAAIAHILDDLKDL